MLLLEKLLKQMNPKGLTVGDVASVLASFIIDNQGSVGIEECVGVASKVVGIPEHELSVAVGSALMKEADRVRKDSGGAAV